MNTIEITKSIITAAPAVFNNQLLAYELAAVLVTVDRWIGLKCGFAQTHVYAGWRGMLMKFFTGEDFSALTVTTSVVHVSSGYLQVSLQHSAVCVCVQRWHIHRAKERFCRLDAEFGENMHLKKTDLQRSSLKNIRTWLKQWKHSKIQGFSNRHRASEAAEEPGWKCFNGKSLREQSFWKYIHFVSFPPWPSCPVFTPGAITEMRWKYMT